MYLRAIVVEYILPIEITIVSVRDMAMGITEHSHLVGKMLEQKAVLVQRAL